jgi:hypothetical protein
MFPLVSCFTRPLYPLSREKKYDTMSSGYDATRFSDYQYQG